MQATFRHGCQVSGSAASSVGIGYLTTRSTYRPFCLVALCSREADSQREGSDEGSDTGSDKGRASLPMRTTVPGGVAAFRASPERENAYFQPGIAPFARSGTLN